MLLDNPALLSLKKEFDAEKIKKEGIVKGTDRGFGFLDVASEKTSYFIPAQSMKNLLPGDRIIAVITEGKEKDKFQANPESLVETSLKDKFVARVCFIENKLHVTPDSPNIKQSFQAEDNRTVKNGGFKEGDWVMCNLTKHALCDRFFRASIEEKITSTDDPKAPWTVSLSALELPLEAPPSVDEYPFLEESFPREDLTHLPFVTIDSQKTEDMDDALYIEKCDDGFNLFVAIADPTGYIDENSDLDKEASERAFSIYLPGRNIPMLPRELSDNLCSLRENEVRASLVAIVHILEDGSIDLDSTEFKLATIKSQGKLIYNFVSDYLENNDTSNFSPNETIKEVLELLVAMTKARDNYRSTEAASFRARPDYEFILTEEGALDHIEVNLRRTANQIVEESMIAANIACGDFLAKNLNTGIFNTHLGFNNDELTDAVELLAKFDYKTTEEELKTISGFCAARRFANSLESSYLDNMLRKHQDFSQMRISPEPHYALGVENYATWTSPIRKYGDMINHRLIKSVICDQEHPRMPNEETLLVMNLARRNNRMAERAVRDWLYTDYLEPDVEKKTIFHAEIFDVVRGGLRVCLKENGAFIFIPISLFSAEREKVFFNVATGEILFNEEPIFRLGDELLVRIVQVEKATRSIVGTVTELPEGLGLANVDEALKKRMENKKKQEKNSAKAQTK